MIKSIVDGLTFWGLLQKAYDRRIAAQQFGMYSAWEIVAMMQWRWTQDDSMKEKWDAFMILSSLSVFFYPIGTFIFHIFN